MENHQLNLQVFCLYSNVCVYGSVQVWWHHDVLQEYADRLRPMVTDTVYLINDVIREDKNVLIEGANAVMLDFDLGE